MHWRDQISFRILYMNKSTRDQLKITLKFLKFGSLTCTRVTRGVKTKIIQHTSLHDSLISLLFENIKFIWKHQNCHWKAANFRPSLSTYGFSAWSGLYLVTPAVTGPQILKSHPKKQFQSINKFAQY